MNYKTILSLFDYSGNWSEPYRENGYNVIQVDLKLGSDIMNFDYTIYETVYGVLAAPPCTDFAVSGNRWWELKDRDGRTYESVKLVSKTLQIINYLKPKFWVLENPVGRLPSFFPKIGKATYFNPCDFGDGYTKKTGLWGNFVFPHPLLLGKHMAVSPIIPPKGSHSLDYYMAQKGKKNRSEWRSVTPLGFSYAFYEVNK